MPWKECSVMELRLNFVNRLEDNESMSDLCKEYGISRTTGYKIWRRYQEKGIDGLLDEIKKPFHVPHKTNIVIEKQILNLKEERPSWGADKIRAYLSLKNPNKLYPSRTTIHNILLKHNWVKEQKKRSSYKASGTDLRSTENPNELWCIDFKGQYYLKDNTYCYPLTVSDHYSRFILGCNALESTKAGGVFASIDDIFLERGLPLAIRSDNGRPFSSVTSILGLSTLNVWFLKHCIDIEFSRPSHPEDNGRHERFHRTLKEDLLNNHKAKNILQQQEHFDSYLQVFNYERPHYALDNKRPGDIYQKSNRIYDPSFEPSYDNYDFQSRVTNCGNIVMKTKRIFLSESLAKQKIGFLKVDEDIWRLDFANIVLGHYDDKKKEFAAMNEFIKV